MTTRGPEGDEPTRTSFPDLTSLHLRHYGLTPSVCGAWAEAAGVCLSRHWTPPTVIGVRVEHTPSRDYWLSWTTPTARQMAASGNTIDAVEHGAYAVALGGVEVVYGMVALRRAATQTGADYHVGSPASVLDEATGELDLEHVFRLEVSGIDQFEREHEFRRRVSHKVQQIRRGHSNLPALVGVVSFRPCLVGYSQVT